MTISEKRRHLHLLLINAKIVDKKQTIVSLYSQGRTTTSRDLTEQELDALIQDMIGYNTPSLIQESCNQMRRKVLSYFHQMQWQQHDGKIDMNRINEWCRTRTAQKKALSEFTYPELIELINQVQQFFQRSTH
jgi:hypothetical protein